MKQILFNSDMVRALLEGRKTVTRRVVKPQPHCYGPSVAYPKHEEKFFIDPNDGWLRCSVCGNLPQYSREGTEVCHFWSPPYRPGDILYVRETWNYGYCDTTDFECQCNETFFEELKPGSMKDSFLFPSYFYRTEDLDGIVGMKWRPSIHMPRDAARIFLRVTDVRVERLQEITDEDLARDFCFCPEAIKAVGRDALAGSFWNSTIKPANRALYGWEDNPWCWVIEFERCEKPKKVAAALGIDKQ